MASHPAQPTYSRVWPAIALGLAALLLPAPAHAQQRLTLVPPLLAAAPERPSFEYLQPQAADYVRASLEEVVLLGLGFAQYATHHDLNSLDWDFGYTWTGLRDKLSPRGYSFDTNGFDTNFIRHPAAGTTYYWAARGNRLTILESLSAAMIASTVWEYIGELRERASLNDIIVTPLSGMVLGEMTMQLGAFFDRSCDTPWNRVLGTLFGPIKTLHDLIDGATPLRELQCDRFGLSRRGAHRFELSAAAGLLASVAGPRVPEQAFTRLELHTQIVAVETYGSPGAGVAHFSDGNVTELWLRSSFAGAQWNDFSLRATVMPLGLHARQIAIDGHGHEVLFGMLVGTEYTVHRFGAWPGPTKLRDRYFELDVPGIGLEYRVLRGALVLSFELQAHAAFIGVDALALPEARAQPSPPPMPTVLRVDGYNYAVGVRLQPRIRVTYRNFELSAELAAVRATAVTISDRYEERTDYARANEQRTLATLQLGIGPDNWPARVIAVGSWLQRRGVLGGVSAERAELSAVAGLAATF